MNNKFNFKFQYYILIALFILIILNFSLVARAANYIEGEEAYNEVLEDKIAKVYLPDDVCSNEQGKCIDAPNESKLRIVEGIAVHRDCWQYEFVKNCSRGPSKNNCIYIQQDDFKFVEDTCLSQMKVGDKSFCINTRKTFARTSLQTEKINRSRIIMDPDNSQVVKNLLCKSFCLDGNCSSVFKETQEANDEIANAIAQLEMLSNIKKGLVDANNLKFDVFGAEVRRCHDKTSLHSDCCSDSGMFKSIGLVKCSAEAKALATESRKGRCEYIGEYCANKKLVCLRKTKTYCCFPSVLAKTIRLGARDQLGKNLGSAERPQCGGLSLNDIENLDFSQIDFQEFFNLEVQPMMKDYESLANENLIKRSFPNSQQSTTQSAQPNYGPNSFTDFNQDGTNHKLFKESE